MIYLEKGNFIQCTFYFLGVDTTQELPANKKGKKVPAILEGIMINRFY